MKKYGILATMFVLAGCMDAAMLVDPNTSVDLMKGNGSVSRDASGNTTFRYVVHADAYNGITSSPTELQKQHEWLIGSYLAQGGHCPNGYTITNRERNETVPAYVYTGTCS